MLGLAEEGDPMTTILIIESNSPDFIARGRAASVFFVRTLLALDQTIDLRIAAPYQQPFTAASLRGVDGVVFTGSGVAWATDAAEAAPLRDAMEIVFAAGRPTWGSCNGMQLASVVLGGAVAASPNGMEIGLARKLNLTAPDHPMMAGRTPPFAVPCIHRDEVTRLPEGAVLIASNTHSPVQAMAYARSGVDFWGTQYHPEMTVEDIAFGVRSRGIFKDKSSEIDDLERASLDDEAAHRVGTTVEEQAMPVRATELSNWLRHVRSGSRPDGVTSLHDATGARQSA